MSIDDIIDHVVAPGGVLVLRPQPGDGSPPVSWGDVYLYYAPDGRIPPGQPFATIVTKTYPDEPDSGLDRPGVFDSTLPLPQPTLKTSPPARPNPPGKTVTRPPRTSGSRTRCTRGPGGCR